jgi:hypothetical protein
MGQHGSGLATDIDSHVASLRARPLSDWETRRAARTVAHHATDSADLAELLAMLGLTADHGKAPA